ncbi:Uncharacterised protein [Klebsiella pneumoniae]|nr:Uncharacterised protein [Klebsiella pneumoniae]
MTLNPGNQGITLQSGIGHHFAGAIANLFKVIGIVHDDHLRPVIRDGWILHNKLQTMLTGLGKARIQFSFGGISIPGHRQ